MAYRNKIGIGASVVLGLIFFVAGFGKLPHQGEYWSLLLFEISSSLNLQLLSDAISNSLPWIELIVGSLLITGIAAKAAACAASLLTFAFGVNNVWMIVHGVGREPCGCFGRFESFLGMLSAQNALALDMGMFVLAVIILKYFPAHFLNAKPWMLWSRR
jgi:uncharacterized membrane protein YphA (DoxX/SURF4 family)